WVFFAIAGTFLWAWGNIFDKVLRTRHLKDSIALTASFGLLSLVIGAVLFTFIGIPSIPLPNLVAAFLGGALITYALIPYLKALSLEEASRVIPMWHFAPVFTLVLAVIFLGEILKPLSYAAFALILFGGFLISVRRVGEVFHLSPAVAFMLLSSLFFSASDVLLKFAYGTGVFWETYFVAFIGGTLSGLSLFVLPNVRRSFSNAMSSKPQRQGFVLLVSLSALAGFFGGVLWNRAILLGPVTLVSVFISFHSLFVLLLATIFSVRFPLFIKEAVNAKTIGLKVAAIGLMAAGLLLLPL
ncbi:DMT family transporter, partial [Candidatus Woesearchaeota archaeon]|nr:DMT family transporter [Candidatus Woesearchaeota archaeon]